MAVAYSMTLSAQQLKGLLAYLDEQFAQAVLEAVSEICFRAIGRPPDNLQFDGGFDPSFWERGRAFGEELELRWRRRSGKFLTLLIAERPLSLPTGGAGELEDLPEPKELGRTEIPPRHVILWGTWQDPATETDLPDPTHLYWYEQHIPRFLAYPSGAPARRLAIEVASYHAPLDTPNTGPHFPGDFVWRFVRVHEALVPSPDQPPTRGEVAEGEHADD